MVARVAVDEGLQLLGKAWGTGEKGIHEKRRAKAYRLVAEGKTDLIALVDRLNHAIDYIVTQVQNKRLGRQMVVRPRKVLLQLEAGTGDVKRHPGYRPATREVEAVVSVVVVFRIVVVYLYRSSSWMVYKVRGNSETEG